MTVHESNAQHARPENGVRTSTDDTRRGPLPNSEDDPAEWASSTLDALDPILDEEFTADELAKEIETPEFAAREKGLHPTTDTSVSTPGSASQLVPGAYPGGSSTPNVLLQDAEQNAATMTTSHVKEVTTSALEVARDYAVKTGEAVSGFLPASVAAYLPGSASNSQAARPDGSASESSPEAVPHVHSDSTATGGENKDIPILTIQPPSQEAHAAEPDHSTKRNTLPAVAEDQTETMREGIVDGGKRESHITVTPHSGSTNTPDHDREHPERPTVNTIESSWDEYHTHEGHSKEVGGADTDASIRSLAGTQKDRSLYTPDTSLFSGKWQDDAQSGASSAVLNLNAHETDTGSTTPADAKAHADSQDTQANTGSQSHPHHALPVHRDVPVTNGREHPLASHEDAQLGPTPSDAQITPGANPAVPLETPTGKEARSGLESIITTTTGEKVVSSVATPGHGPLPVPREDTNAREGVESAVAARSRKASAAGAGAGAGDVAASASASESSPKKSAQAALPHNGDGSHAHAEGKKPGFFERLKKEVKALGGKHHHKEDGAKDVAKD